MFFNLYRQGLSRAWLSIYLGDFRMYWMTTKPQWQNFRNWHFKKDKKQECLWLFILGVSVAALESSSHRSLMVYTHGSVSILTVPGSTRHLWPRQPSAFLPAIRRLIVTAPERRKQKGQQEYMMFFPFFLMKFLSLGQLKIISTFNF